MAIRGGPHHEYRLGSDGRVYALGGQVSLNLNTGTGNSQKSLAKMEQGRRAELVPANRLAIDDQRVAVLARYDVQRTDLETLDQQDEQTLTTPRYMDQQKGSFIDTWV
jgi:DNA-directed RNA polymerase subunit H (RpoH/RPB5)